MKKIFYIIFLSALPLALSAQGLKDAIRDLAGIANTLMVLGASMALLAFFWGLASFILKSGNSEAHEEGKRTMIWGVIALFVIISVWSIVSFLQGEFNLGDTGSPLIQDTAV